MAHSCDHNGTISTAAINTLEVFEGESTAATNRRIQNSNCKLTCIAQHDIYALETSVSLNMRFDGFVGKAAERLEL